MQTCICPPELLVPWRNWLVRDENRVASDLERFCALLHKWQPAQNLVSRETLVEFWTRHIADSLQALPLIRHDDDLIIDLGSGGGFPALPLAIACKGGGHRFVLVESNGRKASFLRTVARELGLPVRVLTERIEAVDSRETGPADLILARALAPLNKLFSLSFPLVIGSGHLLFHKGRDFGEEVQAAGAEWRFDVVTHQSVSAVQGVLLDITRLQRRNGENGHRPDR